MSDLIQLFVVLAVIVASAAYLVVRRLRRSTPHCDKCPDAPPSGASATSPERPRLLQIGRKSGTARRR